MHSASHQPVPADIPRMLFSAALTGSPLTGSDADSIGQVVVPPVSGGLSGFNSGCRCSSAALGSR